ncbi:hypothetical protein KFE25_008560 [Diacronema lutheri]|uniref:Uncharacterized protein n=2 Tax=Diacronema lutheri TaxID=2081491 RepID=A0A8J6CEY7_DIALT|nr:hypothetical protein KFE25_008560 [Diacronema lutheri]
MLDSINYPEVSALSNARRKTHYSGDRPALLLQTKSVAQEAEDEMWRQLAKRPTLPEPVKLPPIEKTADEIRSVTLMHKALSFRRQDLGNAFTTGGPTSNLCAFQVP